MNKHIFTKFSLFSCWLLLSSEIFTSAFNNTILLYFLHQRIWELWCENTLLKYEQFFIFFCLFVYFSRIKTITICSPAEKPANIFSWSSWASWVCSKYTSFYYYPAQPFSVLKVVFCFRFRHSLLILIYLFSIILLYARFSSIIHKIIVMEEAMEWYMYLYNIIKC